MTKMPLEARINAKMRKLAKSIKQQAKHPKPLSSRELATVLAALRYWQQDLAENEEPPISGHFANETPLTVEEIDDLCQRLNFGD